MNTTEFAVKLIQQYNEQHNKLRRAQATQIRIHGDKQWRHDAFIAGISTIIPTNTNLCRKGVLNTFLGPVSHTPIHTIFVSAATKGGAIRSITRKAGLAWSDYNFVKHEMEVMKAAPVNAKLGKIWRKLVNAYFDEKEARKARWEVRCAIKAFNKMNLGVQIKFGNCRNNRGSMSRISCVEVDGLDIKLADFLRNAEFESVILNS